MKFLAWIKFIDAFQAAGAAHGALSKLLYAQALLSITVDAMRDAVTLDKLGLVKAPTFGLVRGWTFAKLNEAVDACLAAVGIAVATLRMSSAMQSEQLAALRTALFKSFCHLGKAFDAGKLAGGPGDRLGALCGLINSLLAMRDVRSKLIRR